jgi:hypothetical protein
LKDRNQCDATQREIIEDVTSNSRLLIVDIFTLESLYKINDYEEPLRLGLSSTSLRKDFASEVYNGTTRHVLKVKAKANLLKL